MSLSIKIKAFILVFVFGLNTAVGFACAVGVNMGFNAHHHEEGTESPMDLTPNHEEHHHHADQHHGKNDDSKKDDCCKDKVVKISQGDKTIPPANIIIHPVFLSTFFSFLNTTGILFTSQVIASNNYFARNYHPPISDIRIAIRSFQI